MEDIPMEKIMSLAAMMGQRPEESEVAAAVSAARRLSAMMNASKPEEPAPARLSSGPEFSGAQSRQIKAVETALPFLEAEYQKSVFLALKIIEFINFQPESAITIMEKGAGSERRLKIINAVESCLTEDEKRKMRNFLNAAKAGAVMR